MNKLKMALLAAGLLVVVFFLGRYTAPEKVKEVEVIKEKRDVVEVVREITRPDGTKEKETRREDRTEKSKESLVEVENSKPQWDVDALYGIDSKSKDTIYGLSVQRRILGNIKVGGWATNQNQLGISVGFEF
jgi:hypothetical protein